MFLLNQLFLTQVAFIAQPLLGILLNFLKLCGGSVALIGMQGYNFMSVQKVCRGAVEAADCNGWKIENLMLSSAIFLQGGASRFMRSRYSRLCCPGINKFEDPFPRHNFGALEKPITRRTDSQAFLQVCETSLHYQRFGARFDKLPDQQKGGVWQPLLLFANSPVWHPFQFVGDWFGTTS